MIERYPKGFGPYRLRARAYAEKKDLDHALADHDQIVRLRPDDPQVYLERSFVRLKKGDNAGAMSDMDRFVQLNPQSFGAYFCRAAMSILSGQGDDCSLADLNRAIALEPGFALSYAFRGYLCARKLMYAPAFSDFGRRDSQARAARAFLLDRRNPLGARQVLSRAQMELQERSGPSKTQDERLERRRPLYRVGDA